MTYITITCIKCGEVGKNSYVSPIKEQMAERKLCFSCNHWTNYAEKTKPGDDTTIEHRVYTPGNGSPGGRWNGMAGRRFDIEYLPNSAHAGKKITTYDLWHGGQLPEWLWSQFPDTAKFLDGAGFVDMGNGHGAFDSTPNKAEKYPSPREAGIR